MSDTIIRDPIHGFISLSHYPFIKEIVETSYFQRLRRLAQLGVSVYVYPSATHNRFNHSLGAMELFVRLFDHLFKCTSYTKNELEYMRKLGVATALLHDIGHGPFSHTTEKIFKFKHEDFSTKIILETKIKDILNNHNIKPQDVKDAIKNTSEENYALISQLISSQLDVDRLDYLARDSYFTGTSFGNIDLERIIRTMKIYNGEITALKGYAISEYKGKYSLESYILSRYVMYQGVYFHKATRCVERLLDAVLRRAQELAQDGKLTLPEELVFLKDKEKMSLEQHQLLDDHILYAILTKWTKNDDEILRDLSRRILNRQLFKALEVEGIEFRDKIAEIQKYVRNDGKNEEYYCLPDSIEDQPYKPYSPSQPDDEGQTVNTAIFILKDRRPTEISKESEVVKALTEHVYKNRIYAPKEFIEQASSYKR